MQKAETDAGDTVLVLVRASREEVRQWQAAEVERKRDAVVKAAGACCVSTATHL